MITPSSMLAPVTKRCHAYYKRLEAAKARGEADDIDERYIEGTWLQAALRRARMRHTAPQRLPQGGDDGR